MGKDILIDTFISLSKTLSFSRTAQEMGISQQAVSKNLARLEAKIGVSLLNRNSHAVSLTEWGESFLKLNNEFQSGLDMLKEQFQASNRQIRILTLNQPEFAPVRELTGLYIPETDIDISIQTVVTSPDGAVVQLTNQEADMIVTMNRFIPENTDFLTHMVCSLEMCLLVSKNHPKYHDGVSYKEFKTEPFVAGTRLDTLFGGTTSFIQHDIDLLNLDPENIIMLAKNDESRTTAAEEYVAKGTGFICGTSLLTPLGKKELVPVPTGKYTHIVCAWNRSSKKVYLNTVAEYIQDLYRQKKIGQE